MAAIDRYRLREDAWLTSMLQRPAWRVVESNVGAPLVTLFGAGPHFATAKVGTGDEAALAEFERFGFGVVDTALNFEANDVRASTDDGRARFATPGDEPAVRALAGSAFQYSRFHLDPEIPPALAHHIKAEWAGNWFRGIRGDGMVVADEGGRLTGFLQLLWSGERLVIDLVAVDASARGRGVARAMIGFAARQGTGDGRCPAAMGVGTQTVNAPSIRLYESLGFRLSSRHHVLHHHGGDRR